MIQRTLQNVIEQHLFTQKILIIYGARQVGKTTLIKHIVNKQDKAHLWLNGDEPTARQLLSNVSKETLKNIFGKHTLIVIDEAQRIPNIGLTLKIAIDQFPNKQIIATGSSAFELANAIHEPLTGRKFEYHLFPLSYAELEHQYGFISEKGQLNQRLLFGSYPEIITANGDIEKRLISLTESYLFKDLLAYEGIQKPHFLEKLLQALALQLGQEVSYNELSNLLGVHKQTVEKYLDLLEKVFVIFRLPSFNRNVRNELKKGKKIYFFDNGIRNALIQNFQPIELRTDKGSLWENYLISERQKRNAYLPLHCRSYFWRTTQQQEVDYIEEYNGKLYAYEFKWQERKKVKFPSTFLNNYSVEEQKIISKENYDEFLR